MSSSTVLLFLVLLILLPSTAVCLTCYTCVYPTISPLDCQTVARTCSAGQRCLYSTATAEKNLAHVELKEKRCAPQSNCDIPGVKRVAGLTFTYTTHCCDTDLCNAAALPSAPCWSRTALSLGSTVLAVLLTSV